MKFLYDLFPIILFFIAYKLQGIYAATAVAMIATVLQVAFHWWKHKRFEVMHLVSFGVIMVMGGLTIALHNKAFIMWKPSVVYWILSLVFLLSPLFFKQTLVERMLSKAVKMPEHAWRRLNLGWVIFFSISGFANLYFALNYLDLEASLLHQLPTLSADDIESLECQNTAFTSAVDLCSSAKSAEELWLNFKVFGLLGLSLVFFLGQVFYLMRYMEEAEVEGAS